MLMHRVMDSKTKVREKDTMPQMCGNPSCNCRAVAQETKSGVWLCQTCLDTLYDALWGFGT